MSTVPCNCMKYTKENMWKHSRPCFGPNLCLDAHAGWPFLLQVTDVYYKDEGSVEVRVAEAVINRIQVRARELHREWQWAHDAGSAGVRACHSVS